MPPFPIRFLLVSSLVATLSTALADEHLSDATSDDVWSTNAVALGASWFANFADGNLDAIVALYADDVVFRNSDGVERVGRDAQLEQLQALYDAGVRFRGVPDSGPVSTGTIGDDGAWGRWRYEVVDAEDNVVGSGESVWIYELVPGGWRIVSVAIYADPPAPEEP